MIFVIYLLTNVITYQFSHAGTCGKMPRGSLLTKLYFATCAYRADARHESFDGRRPFCAAKFSGIRQMMNGMAELLPEI